MFMLAETYKYILQNGCVWGGNIAIFIKVCNFWEGQIKLKALFVLWKMMAVMPELRGRSKETFKEENPLLRIRPWLGPEGHLMVIVE